jgi:cytosine permease
MVTGFPSVLAGFDWFKSGLTLSQVAICSVLSCLILLMYAIPANQLGARSGQSFSMLSRRFFGRYGSYLVSINVIWMFLAWYGLMAMLLAQGLKGIYHWPISTVVLAAALALVMAFNNFFGFTGVANFARFVAAPIMIVWIGYAFFKAAGGCPATILGEAPHIPLASALTISSSFIIGYAVWGNEADYWRYGKPKKRFSLIPVGIALLVGEVFFPMTGWILARMSGISESVAATNFLNQFSLGGISWLAAIVLAATLFAANDSVLFGSVSSFENLWPCKHKVAVGLVATVGACLAAWFSSFGFMKVFESVASLNCILLPTPTVIMLTEWFLRERVFASPPDFSSIPKFDQLPLVRWPAMIALLAGCAVGAVTSGIIPGMDAFRVGICSLQAWLVAMAVYLPLRMIEHRRSFSFNQASLGHVDSLVPQEMPREESTVLQQ